MTAIIDPPAVERFRAAVACRLGLQFDAAQSARLAAVLQRRLALLDMAAAPYCAQLAGGLLDDEPAVLAEDLTVGESYFFRNSEQFRALAEVVVPARLAASGGRLSVLSAGCAAGEEAYSLAITLHEALGTADPAAIAIRAVDINRSALARAARARYSRWALRETPADIQRRWFRRVGRELVLADAARTAVRFEHRNLAADNPDLWQPRSFDIVFCRNVIMYFTPEQARALLTRISRSLHPGGYLFLGSAEPLRGLSDDFDLLDSHGAFYYRRRTGDAADPLPACRAAPSTTGAAPAAAGWATAIQVAAERVSALAAAIPPAPPAPSAPAATRSDGPLAVVLDLLRQERFGEALARLSSPPPAAEDCDVLLLTAALLVHCGQPEAAEERCRLLLSREPGCAGAYYVLALCREACGDVAAAAAHDRRAAGLDAGFAMPRLHLGLLAQRAGDRAAVRRELRQALALLHREDPARLLMFGGGFSRAGLVAVCAAALREADGDR